MSVYTRQIATALRLIQEKGAAITITRKTAGTYNASTGERSGQTTTTQTLYGLNVQAENSDSGKGGIVSDLTKNFVIAASGSTFVPRSGDTATWLSVVYEVKGCDPVSLNGEDILYKIEAT